MKKNIYKINIGGFTLVEMLVALMIFVIVLAITGGVYTTFVQKQRDQLGQQNVQQDVLNFFDMLEREIRTSYGETFPDASNTSLNSLSFNNQNGDTGRVTYSKNANNQIERSEDGGPGLVVTSNRTYVKDLKFLVPSKSILSDDGTYLTGMPTRVTVLVNACVDKDNVSCFSTQTSLSVRQFKPMP